MTDICKWLIEVDMIDASKSFYEALGGMSIISIGSGSHTSDLGKSGMIYSVDWQFANQAGNLTFRFISLSSSRVYADGFQVMSLLSCANAAATSSIACEKWLVPVNDPEHVMLSVFSA